MVEQGSASCPHDARLTELLRYGERLAGDPASVKAEHVQALRDHGFEDRAIHDAAQVVAYFSYINRIADGLGVDPEPEACADPGAGDAPSSDPTRDA